MNDFYMSGGGGGWNADDMLILVLSILTIVAISGLTYSLAIDDREKVEKYVDDELGVVCYSEYRAISCVKLPGAD